MATCNCPVERTDAPMGAYYSAPRCVLSEWHTGDHRAADGSTAPAFLGGALVWWLQWCRAWREIGHKHNGPLRYR